MVYLPSACYLVVWNTSDLTWKIIVNSYPREWLVEHHDGKSSSCMEGAAEHLLAIFSVLGIRCCDCIFHQGCITFAGIHYGTSTEKCRNLPPTTIIEEELAKIAADSARRKDLSREKMPMGLSSYL